MLQLRSKKMSSSEPMTETMIEPKQPRRFEKKANMNGEDERGAVGNLCPGAAGESPRAARLAAP